MVKFGSLPPISRLIGLSIKIEQLRDFITEVAHATFPSGTTFDKCDIGVDVRPTSTTTGNDGISDYWDFWFAGLDCSIGSDD